MQHRVATLLVQHGRRHQNHPTRNPFLKSCRFRLCLVQAAVVNLFILNLVCFISVCPCIPETGRLENTYSCCGFGLWSWLAAVVNLFVLNLLCFISVCLYPKRADCRTRTTYREETKKTLPRRPGHVAPRGAFSCRCANAAILNTISRAVHTEAFPLHCSVGRLLLRVSSAKASKHQSRSTRTHIFECGYNFL